MLSCRGRESTLPPLRTLQELLPLACHVIHAAEDEAEASASRVQQRAQELAGDAARNTLSCIGDVEPGALREEHVCHLLPRDCSTVC